MNPDTFAGALIRSQRLERNFSQEGLCRGICAVSYLSKIEKGLVVPGEEILRRLFAALDLTYTTDETVLAPLRGALESYFTLYFERRDVSELRARLLTSRDTLFCSPLHLSCRLFEALCALDEEDAVRARALLKPLRAHLSQMDTPTLARYYLASALCAPDPDAALAAFTQAEHLLPSAATALHLGHALYMRGRYQDALRHAGASYARAADRGLVPVMTEASFLQGICYSNLFEYDLMRECFERVRSLSPQDGSLILEIDYNTGASYVEQGDVRSAVPFLLRALDAGAPPSTRLLTLHKLALSYQLLGMRAEGLSCIAQAQALLDASPDLARDYAPMLRLVALRFEPDYLHSREYLALARSLYHDVGVRFHPGFAQFHAPFLLQALCANRLYKEALDLTLTIRMPFPSSLVQSLLKGSLKD